MTANDWLKSEYANLFDDIDNVPDWCVSAYWADGRTFRNPTWMDDEFIRGEVWNRGAGRWEIRTMPRAECPAYREGSRWYRTRSAAA
ncbi:MAG TPA: hypothetical protein VH558_04225 [Pseudolabrys sp.]|jgi:hypothetical protein